MAYLILSAAANDIQAQVVFPDAGVVARSARRTKFLGGAGYERDNSIFSQNPIPLNAMTKSQTYSHECPFHPKHMLKKSHSACTPYTQSTPNGKHKLPTTKVN